MTPDIVALLQKTSAPNSDGTFHVAAVPEYGAYYVGREAGGSIAFLIRTTAGGRTVPLRLAGIEARFAVPCRLAEIEGSERTETLTAVICLSQEPATESYFASIVALPRPRTGLQSARRPSRFRDSFWCSCLVLNPGVRPAGSASVTCSVRMPGARARRRSSAGPPHQVGAGPGRTLSGGAIGTSDGTLPGREWSARPGAFTAAG